MNATSHVVHHKSESYAIAMQVLAVDGNMLPSFFFHIGHQPAVDEQSLPLVIDATILQQLLDIEVPKVRAQKALLGCLGVADCTNMRSHAMLCCQQVLAQWRVH